MIKHIVMFQINNKTPERVTHLKNLLEALPEKIKEVQYFEVGADVVNSERSMDLVLISHFATMADLQAYVVHPEHQKVVAWVKANVSLSKAVDFEV